MKKEWWAQRKQKEKKGRFLLSCLARKIPPLTPAKSNGEIMSGLYRPEKGLLVSVDPRVPKPQELYRDVAYYRFCDFLGWQGVAPVFPWQLEPGDKGVIRPYWKVIKNMEIYHFGKKKLDGGDRLFWRRLALADYIFGVGDRVSNDFLITQDGTQVVDSGFSFLPELNFPYQQSIIRDLYRGDSVDDSLLTDLERLRQDFDPNYVDGLIGEIELYWVWERVRRIRSEKTFC